MPIAYGHYIITNIGQRKVAFLADSRNGTQIVCREERGTDETWIVQTLRNGHHVIVNLKDNRRATVGPRAASGEKIEGRNYDKQWLIRDGNFSGEYTIATTDTGRVWGLEDNVHDTDQDTPITLFDQRSDPRTWWTFKRVDPEAVPSATSPNVEVTAARRLVEQETSRRKGAEAELVRQAAELKAVKGELEEARTQAEWEASDNAVEAVAARQELAQAKEEAARTLMELQAARRQAASAKAPNEEVIAARRLAEQETVRRKEAEAELARQVSTLMAVKGEIEETRKQANREMAKRKETEAEVAKKTAEVVSAKREAAQAKEEIARIFLELQEARKDAATAKAVAGAAVAKREEVEYEASRKAAEVEQAMGEVAQSKAEVARTLVELQAARREAAATEAAAKKEEGESEASRKAAEVNQSNGEAAQIEEEAQRTRAFIKSFIMPQLETGRYTITNVGSKNAATLSQVDTESYITGGFQKNGDSEKWGIVLLSNDKYTIKSLATGLYANYEPNPRKGEFIFGSSRAQQWKIKSMWSPGHYVIFPAYAHCYWSLPDSEEGTPASHKYFPP